MEEKYVHGEKLEYICRSKNRVLEITCTDDEIKKFIKEPFRIWLWDLDSREISHILAYYGITSKYPKLAKHLHDMLIQERVKIKNCLNFQETETPYFKINVINGKKLTDETDILVKTGFKKHTWTEPIEAKNYYFHEDAEEGEMLQRNIIELLNDLNDEEIEINSIINKDNSITKIYQLLFRSNIIKNTFFYKGYCTFRYGKIVIDYDEDEHEIVCHDQKMAIVINPSCHSTIELCGDDTKNDEKYRVTTILDYDNMRDDFKLLYSEYFPEKRRGLLINFNGEMINHFDDIPQVVDKNVIETIIETKRESI